MTYFEDLSEYSYFARYHRRGTKNVGWLGQGYAFPKDVPSEEMLDLLWSFCSISVVQTRGIHQCELCESPRTVYAIRNGTRFKLGSAEIRVFGRLGDIYAAPNLIYHYVRSHQYQLPNEFLSALNESPRPPSSEYFDRLRELDLEWNKTFGPAPQTVAFRFEKINGQVRRVEVPRAIHIDDD